VVLETGVIEAADVVPTVAFTLKELKVGEGVLKGTTMRSELIDLKCSTVPEVKLGNIEDSVFEETGPALVVCEVLYVELLIGKGGNDKDDWTRDDDASVVVRAMKLEDDRSVDVGTDVGATMSVLNVEFKINDDFGRDVLSEDRVGENATDEFL